MNIATSYSLESETKTAVQSVYSDLMTQLGAPPTWLVLYASIAHDGAQLTRLVSQLAPTTKIHGGSSCLGAMTAAGFHSDDGVGLAMWGIHDPAGQYGVGAADVGDDPRKAGEQAVLAAIADAQRYGQPPELVWITGVPGCEEAVLQGIQDVIGVRVPIAGGSSADNTVSGHWEQYRNDTAHKNSVVVTALYPSKPIHLAFHSGYSPTDKRGVVTKVDGRILCEIDGKPAAQLYDQWTNGTVRDHLGTGGNVLSATTLYPLGYRVGSMNGVAYHRLLHPDSVTADDALTLFANLEMGDEIVLMEGTEESLVERAGRVAQAALDVGRISADQIAGALVVYCAGCMLTVQGRMDDVAGQVAAALDDKPFIGTFTFGEQGCFVGGENHHGNLMISVAVFEK